MVFPHLANNAITPAWSKHIDICHLFICEELGKGAHCIEHIESRLQEADVLNKDLTPESCRTDPTYLVHLTLDNRGSNCCKTNIVEDRKGKQSLYSSEGLMVLSVHHEQCSSKLRRDCVPVYPVARNCYFWLVSFQASSFSRYHQFTIIFLPSFSFWDNPDLVSSTENRTRKYWRKKDGGR